MVQPLAWMPFSSQKLARLEIVVVAWLRRPVFWPQVRDVRARKVDVFRPWYRRLGKSGADASTG